MKIGIYAGTFDPVHNGHIQFAVDAITKAALDLVVVVAEKNPYRKKPHASWDHRQAMIEHATETLGNVDHDYAFANALAHQHTMNDMLAVAERHYGAEHEFWFLVGSDVYEHIHQWHSLISDESYGGFIVALRDDHTHDWLKAQQVKAAQTIGSPRAVILEGKHQHISSSAIRTNIKKGLDAKDVPAAVASYIQRHVLYQNH